MRDEIIKKVSQHAAPQTRLNYLREELHHFILQEADRHGAFRNICFIGGTALRILFDLNRYSEDLDFSISMQSKKFDLSKLATVIQQSLLAFQFDCHITKLKKERTVQSCFFQFHDLLHRLNAGFRKEQKLAVKFEVDTRPPAGAVETMSPVTGSRLYKVRHYDLSSLYAGKLHAILCRKYTKGRDLYDFLWYQGKNVAVNGKLLANAIQQTEKQKLKLDAKKLQKMLQARFQKLNFTNAKKDVAPFLPPDQNLDLFDKDLFLSAAQKVEVT